MDGLRWVLMDLRRVAISQRRSFSPTEDLFPGWEFAHLEPVELYF